jgi:hypothetical protein
MTMCEFCNKGLTHPNATRNQLAKERAGCKYGMYDGMKFYPLPDNKAASRFTTASTRSDEGISLG